MQQCLSDDLIHSAVLRQLDIVQEALRVALLEEPSLRQTWPQVDSLLEACARMRDWEHPVALDDLVLFQAADGQVSLDVHLEADTVWLSQAQMAELFGRECSVISKHIGNVFKEGELGQESTCAKLAQVQMEGTRVIQRQVDFYNLDVIISVGYRVKSPRGTQFRIWATRVLRQHLIQGYTLHQRRLQERGLSELEQALAPMTRTLSSRGLVSDEGQAVLEVVQRYSRAWRWLLAYDEDRLAPASTEPDRSPEVLALAEAQRAIETLRADLARCGEATPLFGQNNRKALGACCA